ncbi:MAG: Phosphoribosyl transferase domain protein [Candidatus Roizmanbacteria bacterium GW2011_GWA2_36_23]|uniref:Phosphoribosyl transferase domain protein n=1 Tax=Candidatus Roizmanbacteria bacterium GW2011_GWA2_36_23 TaxID=1618480 RepID=A0A0G0HC73_9BACT|nr:MAG: Phosphoribosyl transferase domain protein [Candidatus Roizmanbacteria bacterium GW2011_GWA2_36_23]
MKFKDREEAAYQLLQILRNHEAIQKNIKKVVVVSLLRGGVVVGNILARGLSRPHLLLASLKIPSPHNPELGIGALCFDIIYLEPAIVSPLELTQQQIKQQIKITENKFKQYKQIFSLKKTDFKKKAKNKIVLLVDDGIATGSTIRAAALFLKKTGVDQIFIAAPVAPADFDSRGFNGLYILHNEDGFSSVSQFYENFPQISNEEVKKILYT